MRYQRRRLNLSLFAGIISQLLKNTKQLILLSTNFLNIDVSAIQPFTLCGIIIAMITTKDLR